MGDYRFDLHFAGDTTVELYETRFVAHVRDTVKVCVRGKTCGAYQGAGTFQWSSAVRALSVLAIRHNLSQSPVSGIAPQILGELASLAASLDYAITKQPIWITEMFGTDAHGLSLVRRFVVRTNSNRKRTGPVVVALNANAFPSGSVRIFLNGKRVTESESLMKLLETLEGTAKSAAGDGSSGVGTLIAA